MLQFSELTPLERGLNVTLDDEARKVRSVQVSCDALNSARSLVHTSAYSTDPKNRLTYSFV